jgi:hypothetical protein
LALLLLLALLPLPVLLVLLPQLMVVALLSVLCSVAEVPRVALWAAAGPQLLLQRARLQVTAPYYEPHG